MKISMEDITEKGLGTNRAYRKKWCGIFYCFVVQHTAIESIINYEENEDNKFYYTLSNTMCGKGRIIYGL